MASYIPLARLQGKSNSGLISRIISAGHIGAKQSAQNGHGLLNLQVMELSENLKLRLDQPSNDSQHDRLSRSPDATPSSDALPNDDAELQMRKALGLLGKSSRQRPDPDRTEQPPRGMGDRFANGLHRRRFVQDGDIPVTVLRRNSGQEQPAFRGTPSQGIPTSSRLQRTEAALAAETAARERAERSLADTQSIVRDLQTKIGHAELAKAEALEALQRERDAIVQLRADATNWDLQLQEAREQAETAKQNGHSWHEQLSDERNARKAAERALRIAETERDTAQELIRTLSRELAAPTRSVPIRGEPARRGRPPQAEPEVVEATAKRRRSGMVAASEAQAEPEPVKWWLNTKPTGKRR